MQKERTKELDSSGLVTGRFTETGVHHEGVPVGGAVRGKRQGRSAGIACVGKPSAGKSSFLNAVTDANAKTGAFPFTTIKPNRGVTFSPIECACKKVAKQELCKPRYGRCVDGTRYVPVQMLDVAGLVPGASEGQGLGNQFLDDLRHADVLIHVVDVSGTTDQNGKATIGYDPMNDIEWLNGEIHSWIFNNLHKRWSSIVRRHVATKSTAADTLHAQFSGYGTTQGMTAKCLERLGLKDPLEGWDDETLRRVVASFTVVRFPTVVALNKIDLPESDKNIARICRKYGENRVVLTSALSECFIRKIQKQGYVQYVEGTDHLYSHDDKPEAGLKELDDKLRNRIEKVQDLVLFRFGTTGVQEVIKKAVELLGVVPAFPVKNVTNFSSQTGKTGIFRDCMLLPPGTTVRQFAKMCHDDLDRYYLYAETVGQIRLAEDDLVTPERNIICFKTSQAITPAGFGNLKKDQQSKAGGGKDGQKGTS